MNELIHSEHSGGQAIAEMSLAKTIAEVLTHHYPNFIWSVTVDATNGIATVENVNLPGKWGFYLHLAKLDAGGRRIVMAGGELLERFNLRRRRMDGDAVAALGYFAAPET